MKYEPTKREEKNKARRLKGAKFPYQKTFEDYNLNEQTSLGERQMHQLKEMNWLEQQYNLILLGPPGVGKTHLAVSFGLVTVEQGYQVMFLPIGELTTILKTSDYTRKSQIALYRIKKTDLVIIYDLMDMAMDPMEANQFFQLVDYLY